MSYQLLQQKRLIAENRCVRCWTEPARPGRRNCAKCAAKASNRYLKRVHGWAPGETKP